jgi:Ca2+-binding RTX toxin-like protein
VSTAGDVNGDGVDDLLIGAYRADPNGYASGASYVVFGGAGIGNGGNLELSALDGTNGFRLSGAAAFDFSGVAVSTAGDVNGDGVDDLLIGAPFADPNGDGSGASYVVFGQATPPVTCNGLPATIVGTDSSETINGTNQRDVIQGLGGNDRIRGRGGNDVICGGEGNDRLSGKAGADELFGENGDDRLNGGSGFDTCNGGAGVDRAHNCQIRTDIP